MFKERQERKRLREVGDMIRVTQLARNGIRLKLCAPYAT
jgi:hypothetical protein